MREQHGMTLLGSTLARTASINPVTGRRGLQLPSVLHKLKHPRSQGAALTPVSFLSIPFPGSLAVSTVPTCVPPPLLWLRGPALSLVATGGSQVESL